MDRLRELLQQLTLHFQVEIAMADVIEEQNKRIKKLEDEKLKVDTRLLSLDKRYSELLMVLKDINKKLPNPLR